MMMILGMFPFFRETLPYDDLQHKMSWRHPSNSRSGQSSFPNKLDSSCTNPLIYHGVLCFSEVRNHCNPSEEVELIRSFFGCLLGLPMVGDDTLVLLVSELKDVHFTTLRQAAFHAFGVGVDLCRTRTKAHVNAQLTHLKPHIQQRLTEIGCGFPLCLFEHRKVKHDEHPHEPIPCKHDQSVPRLLANAMGNPGNGKSSLSRSAR